MSKSEEQFERQSYFRLLKYAAPYKFRLTVGILAGFVVAGSMFGSFMLIPKLTMGLDNGERATEMDERRSLAKEIYALARDEAAFPSEAGRLEAISAKLSPEESGKLETEVEKIKGAAARIGIDLPLSYCDGEMVFSGSWLSFTLPIEDADGGMTWQFFSLFVIGFVFLWGMKNLFTYVNRYYMRWVGTRVVADLRNKVFARLMGQSLKFYGKHDVGQLISRCTNDTASIESAVANVIADATRCPLEILACAAAIIYASVMNNDLSLPLILFLGMPLVVVPIMLLGKKIRKVYRSAFKRIAEVVSRMHEVFTGIVVVKAYHGEERETERFRNVNRKYFRTVVGALKLELLMTPLMETVAVGATLVFLVYSYSQKVTLTELTALLVPAVMAYQPIKKLAKVTTYIQRSMAAADRYFNLIDTDTGLVEKDDAVEVAGFDEIIKFNGVTFSYEPGKRVLRDISFDIPKGSVVAVVGETGSGKTTVANLIARFYDVDSGSVTMDGRDLRDIKIASLRGLIGIVTQDSILFNDTIAANIAYGRPAASLEAIIEAAKQANAHQFIEGRHHAEGYDTVVGEKGFKLSGGEKQRIAIARAILKNPPILILDEATSALDTVTERLVQEALDRVMENRTVFAIAHRLSTIKHADMILVMDEGEIVERGNHDELMAAGGRYKKLHDTQFGMG